TTVLADEPAWKAAHDAGWKALNDGDFTEAEKQFRAAFDMVRTLGRGEPRVASSCDDLAYLYFKQGRAADAEPLAKSAIAAWEAIQPPASTRLAWSLGNLAGIYAAQSKYTEAEPVAERALALTEQRKGDDDVDTVPILSTLGVVYSNRGKPKQA